MPDRSDNMKPLAECIQEIVFTHKIPISKIRLETGIDRQVFIQWMKKEATLDAGQIDRLSRWVRSASDLIPTGEP